MALWNLYQEMNIRALRGGANLDRSFNDDRHAQQRDRAEDLDERIDRLLLLTEAMWELLSKHLGFTDEHLAHMVATIDHRDGHLDNRAARPARRCQACESAVPADRPTCQFCGVEVPGSSLFDQT